MNLVVEKVDDDGKSQAGDREGPKANVKADFAEVNDQLPYHINKNSATRLSYQGNGVDSGSDTVAKMQGRPGGKAIADKVWAPNHLAVVRSVA